MLGVHEMNDVNIEAMVEEYLATCGQHPKLHLNEQQIDEMIEDAEGMIKNEEMFLLGAVTDEDIKMHTNNIIRQTNCLIAFKDLKDIINHRDK